MRVGGWVDRVGVIWDAGVRRDTAATPGGGLGLLIVFLHFGMCLAATSSLKRRMQ